MTYELSSEFIPTELGILCRVTRRTAEMDYAGVDKALLHRIPYLSIGNELIGDFVRRFPDRLQGLAHVEEWLVQTKPDASIRKLERAVKELGLSGLQFLPDHLTLYGQSEDWNRLGFRPFWDAVAGLDIPVFFTPSYSSLATPGGAGLEAFISGLATMGAWMERYPGVKVILTHGLAWRFFIEGDSVVVPDEVFDALPTQNPNFSLQVLLAILLGGIWDYPMPQVRPTMEKLVDRMGTDRLVWGTDMPMVMRFYTYRQNLEHIRLVCDFLGNDEVDMIVVGNMERLMSAGGG